MLLSFLGVGCVAFVFLSFWSSSSFCFCALLHFRLSLHLSCRSGTIGMHAVPVPVARNLLVHVRGSQ